MPQLTVKIHDGKLKTILGNAILAVRSLPKKVIKAEMEIARDEVREYPPERAGQRYIRTGKRYAATKLEAVDNGYRLVSNPRYADGRTGNPYTIGDARGQGQAWMHKGRWVLLADAVKRATERIVKRAREMFNEDFLLKGPGGL